MTEYASKGVAGTPTQVNVSGTVNTRSATCVG